MTTCVCGAKVCRSWHPNGLPGCTLTLGHKGPHVNGHFDPASDMAYGGAGSAEEGGRMTQPHWDKATADAILERLQHVGTYTRLYGDQWQDFLDQLAEDFGAEPDMRPRLYITAREEPHDRPRA